MRNPKQDPTLDQFDLVRRLTGGERPAERLARAEEELRRRPEAIIKHLTGKPKPRPKKG